MCRPCRLPGPHLLLPHARLSHLAHPTGPPSARQALDLVWGATPPRLLAQAVQHGIVARVKQLPDLSPLRHLAALNLADNNLVEVGGLVGGWVGWCVGVPEARAGAELLIAGQHSPPNCRPRRPQPVPWPPTASLVLLCFVILPQVPPWLLKMTGLEVVDFSGNFFLECKQPLNQLQAFKRLRCAWWAERLPYAVLQCLAYAVGLQACITLAHPLCVARRWLDLRAVHVEAETSKYWSPAKW